MEKHYLIKSASEVEGALERQTINAMNHNIPCVKISPCGNFIAATSIDCSTRIFIYPSKEQIFEIQLDNWGWGINWVPKQLIYNSQQVPPSAFKEDTYHQNLLRSYYLTNSLES